VREDNEEIEKRCKRGRRGVKEDDEETKKRCKKEKGSERGR
jgi:hypothetical protein